MRKILLPIFLCLLSLSLSAQTPSIDFFSENPDAAGGIYYSYHYTPAQETPVPKGYDLVYVSHYGRHGSRFHEGSGCYTIPRKMLDEAYSKGMLTKFGEDLREQVSRVALHAAGNAGALTQLGEREHKGIAERMYRRSGRLFRQKNGKIVSMSTLRPRCIISMTAFTERMKELNPSLGFTRIVNDSTEKYLLPSRGREYRSREMVGYTDRAINQTVNEICGEWVEKIFKPEYRAVFEADRKKFEHQLRNLYYLGMVMQCSEGDERIEGLFTPEQRFRMWEKISRHRFAQWANSTENGDAIMYDGAVFLGKVVEDADDALENGGRIACLRFGHDVTVQAALGLLRVKGIGVDISVDDRDLWKKWQDFNVTPMAANLQWYFYRNRKNGEILVKMLHNEKECILPIESASAPYYRWSDLRTYYMKCIDGALNGPVVREIEQHRAKKKRKETTLSGY